VFPFGGVFLQRNWFGRRENTYALDNCTTQRGIFSTSFITSMRLAESLQSHLVLLTISMITETNDTNEESSRDEGMYEGIASYIPPTTIADSSILD